jgi:hypothetical protein
MACFYGITYHQLTSLVFVNFTKTFVVSMTGGGRVGGCGSWI